MVTGRNARLSESTDAELLREIADGEERFEQGGRSRFSVDVCAVGANGLRGVAMGYVERFRFHPAFPVSWCTGFSKQRPEMNSADGWGYYSPRAEAHLQSIMGLQTWNSIRSLDFLLSLPEVDPERTAHDGCQRRRHTNHAAGGGRSRLKLSFPAVMVSTAMQGGCTCENCLPPSRGHRQHRIRRFVCPETAGDDERQ
jgi:hypothetical protein